jgi:hypothetical protein
MRLQFLEKKDAVRGALAAVLANPAQERQDAERDAEHAAEALGVSGRARRDFVDQFVDTRLDQLQGLAPLAQGTTMDWQGLLDGSHALFRAEDAVVEKSLGPAALPAFREEEMSKRLTILSMLATYANADWDEAIAQP